MRSRVPHALDPPVVITEAFVALSAFVAGAMFVAEPSGRGMTDANRGAAVVRFWAEAAVGGKLAHEHVLIVSAIGV